MDAISWNNCKEIVPSTISRLSVCRYMYQTSYRFSTVMLIKHMIVFRTLHGHSFPYFVGHQWAKHDITELARSMLGSRYKQ